MGSRRHTTGRSGRSGSAVLLQYPRGDWPADLLTDLLPEIVGNGRGASFVSVTVGTAEQGRLTPSVAGQDGSVAVCDVDRPEPHPYSGLVDARLLGWAVEMLTDGDLGTSSLHIVHGDQAAGDQALRLVRRHRRRHAFARALGLGPEPAAPAPQASFGRRRLAETFAELPFRARVAVLLVDACAVPVLDVAAGLGWTTGRVRRALELGRRELAGSVALSADDAAAIAPALGAALRSLAPPSAVTATTWARQSALGRATA